MRPSSTLQAPLPSDAESSRSQEHQTQSTSLASTPSGRPRPRVHQPAKGSLHDLLRQHPGTALFVRPIGWTDFHLKLLGVEFEELSPCVTPSHLDGSTFAPLQGHGRPSPTLTLLSKALLEIFKPSSVQSILGCNAVKAALTIMWPGTFSRTQHLPELNIVFGPKMYHDAVRVQAMWNFPTEDLSSQSQASTQSTLDTLPLYSPSSQTDLPTGSPTNPTQPPTLTRPTTNLPMLCYIGKHRLTFTRNSLLKICSGPGKSANTPVLRLQRLRAKMLMPLDPDRDAHFVGIFLAMAQRHFYEVQPPPAMRRESFWWPLDKGPLPRPDFRDLKLRIMTHDIETSEFLVYTAYVTAKFLERFHLPFQNPGSHDNDEDEKKKLGMKIEYIRVPAFPVLGLRERLGKALGEDIVGPFDPNNMETWAKVVEEEEEEEEEGEEQQQQQQQQYDEGTEDEMQVEKQHDKKRNRDALAQVLNGSFEKDSDSESTPQQQQQQELGRKKRRLRQGHRVGVVV